MTDFVAKVMFWKESSAFGSGTSSEKGHQKRQVFASALLKMQTSDHAYSSKLSKPLCKGRTGILSR